MTTLIIPSAQSTLGRGVLSIRKPLLPNAVGVFVPTLYKIFSKVLAYRLKKVLARVIVEHHLTFAKDHLIFL